MKEHLSSNLHHEHYVPPLWNYLLASGSLFLLTGITVVTSRLHLGAWEMPLAMALASAKVLVVMLVFMGLLWEKSVNLVILASTAVFVFIFFSITLSDIVYRGHNNQEMAAENVHGLLQPLPKAIKLPQSSPPAH